MSQVAVILFVDEKIQLPANLVSLFEVSKEKRGNCNGLCVEVRRYATLDEIKHHSDGQAWLLAANGNGCRMTRTRRFTPSAFKLTVISPNIKNVIVVDPNRNKNPEGMISNVFAWIVKANDGEGGQPFYGSPKQANKKSRNRGNNAYRSRYPISNRMSLASGR